MGHPLPGVAVKIVDPETMEPLPPNQEGLLLVKGPNRMLGYLDNPSAPRRCSTTAGTSPATSRAIDDEGFLRITDRLSRFSKIGGEMVPHLQSGRSHLRSHRRLAAP